MVEDKDLRTNLGELLTLAVYPAVEGHNTEPKKKRLKSRNTAQHRMIRSPFREQVPGMKSDDSLYPV